MSDKLRLVLGPDGLGTVELNGKRISCMSVSFDAAAGERSRAVIHLAAIELDAKVGTDTEYRVELLELPRGQGPIGEGRTLGNALRDLAARVEER